MISIQVKLSVVNRGSRSPFHVARVITDIGIFASTCETVQQLSPGNYTGEAVISKVFLSQRVSGPTAFTEMNAVLKSFSVDSRSGHTTSSHADKDENTPSQTSPSSQQPPYQSDTAPDRERADTTSTAETAPEALPAPMTATTPDEIKPDGANADTTGSETDITSTSSASDVSRHEANSASDSAIATAEDADREQEDKADDFDEISDREKSDGPSLESHEQEDYDEQDLETILIQKGVGSDDRRLFGHTWPLHEVVKLDSTVGRDKLQEQAKRLRELGYDFNFRDQAFHFNFRT
jgi:hypothetical protein